MFFIEKIKPCWDAFWSGTLRQKMVAIEILLFGRPHMHRRVLRKVLRMPYIQKMLRHAVEKFLEKAN